MTDRVSLFEVSMRDGLQNEPIVVPTADKIAHLHRLLAAGLTDIEVTSFVRADRIPALADAADVVAALPTDTGARFWALVPNPVGLDRAFSSGIRHICTFLSSSETHNAKNVNRTVRESVADLRRVMGTALDEGMSVRAYVSTVFGCPYEGYVAPEKVRDLVLTMLDVGAQEVALGDTTGIGTPGQVTALVKLLVDSGAPIERLALHTHDTHGMAAANVYAAFNAGIRRFDGSVAGIGGCPYAPGAAGNAATEDLVYLFRGLGVETGVDLDRLAIAGHEMARLLGRELPGRVHRATLGAAVPARKSA